MNLSVLPKPQGREGRLAPARCPTTLSGPTGAASGIRDLRFGHRRGQAHLPNLRGSEVPLLLLQSQFVACALADLGSTGRFEFCHASQPPTSARAFDQPACLSSCATRALVASFGQAQ